MHRKIYSNIEVYEIDLLNASDPELEGISADRSLGLSLDEMRKIRDYFRLEGRNPRDVELEALAQSWSEHCCYKTSRPIMRDTIFKVKTPHGISVISEDAAVIEFNRDYAYVVKIESHNHPSALDPYGGAATGVGGILRDIVCMGAQPLALVDPLFFGPQDYPESRLPEGVKHPQFLFKGVVSGIAAYGNRVGIPTVSGMVFFDESYVGNCLVNVGCIGIVRKDRIAHSWAGNAQDVYILVGGKTGRDGIHGVTFASAELTGESEKESRPAVQLGYAIMKEPLIHACLEANDCGLLTGMKDLGGGGLSCVSSEMAHLNNKGASVELDNVPLKERGLAPWEIWVSESQERMMLSVKPENVKAVLEIFQSWDVPATIVGVVDDSKRIKAAYRGKEVLNLDLDFLIKGVEYCRNYVYVERKVDEPVFRMPNLEKSVMRIFKSANVGSKEAVIRRYDHEVRGNTILKPMQGVVNSQTHGDAVVLKPLQDSFRGLSLTCDVNPLFCRLDPYWGSASAVDEVVRNLVAVNSKPHTIVDCLNFANPEKPERLGEFKKSCHGLYFAAESFNVPFVSGNVSLYNESILGPVAPTPTLFGVGIVKDVRKVVSADLKKSGSLLFLVGETRMEFGGSQYYQILGFKDNGVVPEVRPKETKKNASALLKSMDKGLVESAHDLSEGGLIVAAAEMGFGGNLGLDLDLRAVNPELRTDFKLFSESNGRWLVEVRRKNKSRFLKSGVTTTLIGKIVKNNTIRIKDENRQEKDKRKRRIDLRLGLEDLRTIWSKAIQKEG